MNIILHIIFVAMKYVLPVLLMVSQYLTAQDKKFEVGINIGAYKANSYTATRYDGYDGEYPYDFSVEYYLNLGQNNQYSWYNQIKQQYNNYDFKLGEYPEYTSMRYNIGLVLGGHLGIRTSEMNTFFIDVDFVNLKIEDAITFEITDPSVQTSEPVIEIEKLVGLEKRLNTNIGFHIGLGEEPESTPYMEIGGNITSTRVEKHSLYVKEKEYVLTRYNRNGNSIYNKADYGGVGWGGFMGFGYRFVLKDQVIVDLGANAIYTKIALGPDIFGLERKFKLQYAFYLRAIWNF